MTTGRVKAHVPRSDGHLTIPGWRPWTGPPKIGLMMLLLGPGNRVRQGFVTEVREDVLPVLLHVPGEIESHWTLYNYRAWYEPEDITEDPL